MRITVWRRFRKFPLVRQYEQRDCGPAVLLSILQYYGGRADLTYVRELCRSDSNGTTMYNLIHAARIIGFDARGVAAGWESLHTIKFPCIAHVVVDSHSHFIVLRKCKGPGVYVSDPAQGSLKLSKSSFLRIWHSRALVLLEPDGLLLDKKPHHWFTWCARYLKTQKTWLYQSVFLGVIYTIIGLFTAVFIRILIDRFIPAAETRNILLTTVILVFLFTLRAAAGFFRNRFLLILGRNTSLRINAGFLEHLYRLPKKFFDTRQTGDITSRLNDAIKVQQAILQVVGAAAIDILIICGSGVFIFVFSKTTGMLMLAAIPIYTVILGLQIQRIRSGQAAVMQSFAKMESSYIDSLQGIDDIISYNASAAFAMQTKNRHMDFQSLLYKLGIRRAHMVLLSDIAGMLIMVLILCNGALQVVYGDIQLGQFMAAYALVTNIIPAINRITESSIDLQEASVAIKRILDVMLSNREKSAGAVCMPRIYNIRLVSAGFVWPGGKRLLDDVSLDIKKGSITALSGASGCGKTTLADLLQRKYDLSSGNIKIGRLKASRIDLNEYREGVAVVPQNSRIFNGTLADNIMLGRTPETGFDLSHWLHLLGLDNYIRRFEFGLLTPVGEENRRLSNGEMQVVAYLRAVFSRPELLIIDEGMSSLDFETGEKIFGLLRKYAKQHAVLIITHNLTTISRVDYVYVLQNGRIGLQGRPDIVLSRPERAHE